jgi:peroxiredoxin
MSKGSAAVDLGGPAPDFTLASSSGGQIKLSEVVGTAHTILYFFREFS